MSMTLKPIYDRHFQDVKFDRGFCQRVDQFTNNFFVKNDDHAAFFGGVLLGVHPVRFLEVDRNIWFDEVLEIDDQALQADHIESEAINKDFNVLASSFNYIPAYVSHRLMNERSISKQTAHTTMVNTFAILHCRYLTSLLSHYFKYAADPDVASATYMQLTNRYDIRRYESWRALILARSKSLVEPNSIFYKTLQNFGPDQMLIRVATDTQTRLRSTVLGITKLHMENSQSGVRTNTTSVLGMNADGETILKDRSSKYLSYKRYIANIIPSKTDFIKDELVDVVTSVMSTVSKTNILEALNFMSSSFGDRKYKYLEEMTEELVQYTFDFLNENRDTFGKSTNLSTLIIQIRSLLTASRASNATVIKLRKHADKLVSQSVRSKNATARAGVRTGILLYVILRTMTKESYSK